ncbi:MAG: helix-turn-helix transcriptional regulator [Oceanobacter sp.]
MNTQHPHKTISSISDQQSNTAPIQRDKQPTIFNPDEIDRVVRLKEVKHLSGQSTTGIYKAMANGTFPKSFKLGGAKSRIVGWRLSAIMEWIDQQEQQSHQQDANSAGGAGNSATTASKKEG